jgi:hypothetical protein
MASRWGTFAIGLGLLLAPLAVGYATAGAILRDVSAGTLVCVAAVASLQWPRARVVHVLAALWLADSARRGSETRTAAVELSAAVLLLGLALLPRRRRLPPGELAAPELRPATR